MSLGLENVTRVLPDLNADDIILEASEDRAGDVDAPEKLLEEWPNNGSIRKHDWLKSAREAGFAVRTLKIVAKKLGVVRSLLEQEHIPRNNWPIVSCLAGYESSGLSFMGIRVVTDKL